MNHEPSTVWVFGYGSLIWGTGEVQTAERLEGYLRGWHREWTWISSTRHGAPTCGLCPGGEVKGVFLRLNPNTVRNDLEQFRQRENRDTEQTAEDSPQPGALTHFWTMRSNLDRFPEFRGLNQEQLREALARRAQSVMLPGRDGVLAVDYIRRVHEFDSDDRTTAEIYNHL
jgi:ChaC-like protein